MHQNTQFETQKLKKICVPLPVALFTQTPPFSTPGPQKC